LDVKQLEEFLLKTYPDAQLDIGRRNGMERISGRVITHAFDNLEPIDRQMTMWELIRQRFGSESQDISLILTYTPDEYRRLKEE
jgi:acid stress-induced BolA-like protein IbaG/YrbA